MDIKKYHQIISFLKGAIENSKFENHVYAVGGCVRDALLGNPIKDIDLVVDLENGGIALAKFLQENGLLLYEPVIFETYGTVQFRLKEFLDDELECVQTRKEQYHDKESRNPETSFGSIMDDCMRRDLTINALYKNVTTGEVIDPCGKGIEDIKNKIIEVTSTPEIVYEDDPLRIMRAVRFYCKMGAGWNMNPKTYEGLVSHASRLEIITKERIQDELNKILLTKDYVKGIIMLKQIRAMEYIIPELLETYDMKQNEYHFGTVWEHTLAVLNKIDTSGYEGIDVALMRLAALLHDIGKIRTYSEKDGKVHFYKHEFEGARLTEKIMRRLKYSNDDINEVKFLVEYHMYAKPWKNDLSGFRNESRRDAAIRKLQFKCKTTKKFNMLMRLIDADNKSHAEGHCLPTQTRLIENISAAMRVDGTDMFNYKMIVTGDDVMEYKGIKSGPAVRKYLDMIMKECYFEPKISKEDALKIIKKIKFE